jgi:hypothetical protein
MPPSGLFVPQDQQRRAVRDRRTVRDCCGCAAPASARACGAIRMSSKPAAPMAANTGLSLARLAHHRSRGCSRPGPTRWRRPRPCIGITRSGIAPLPPGVGGPGNATSRRRRPGRRAPALRGSRADSAATPTGAQPISAARVMSLVVVGGVAEGRPPGTCSRPPRRAPGPPGPTPPRARRRPRRSGRRRRSLLMVRAGHGVRADRPGSGPRGPHGRPARRPGWTQPRVRWQTELTTSRPRRRSNALTSWRLYCVGGDGGERSVGSPLLLGTGRRRKGLFFYL